MAGYNLTDKEQVKEFLKKLLIEYSFGCYSEKNPEGKIFAKTKYNLFKERREL